MISAYGPEETQQMKNISSQASLLKFSKNSKSLYYLNQEMWETHQYVKIEKKEKKRNNSI